MSIPRMKKLALILLGCIFSISCNPPGTFSLPDWQTTAGSWDFKVRVPRTGCKMRSDNPRAGEYTIDFYLSQPPFGPLDLYSVEWVSRDKKKDLDEDYVYKYFETFIPDYLAKNFGKGHYTLLFKAPIKYQGKHPAIIFIGSGKHNGGRPGSIYGVTVYMGHHWATMYALKDQPINPENPALSSISSLNRLPEYDQFRAFSDSLEYTGGQKNSVK